MPERLTDSLSNHNPGPVRQLPRKIVGFEKHPQDYDAQMWIRDATRVVRRVQILRNYSRQTGEIKSAVRKHESQVNPRDSFAGLTESVFNIHPGFDSVMREIADIVVTPDSNIAALMLVGGGLRGGENTREAVGINYRDIDMLTILKKTDDDPDFISEQLLQTRELIERLIPEIAARYGLEDLKMCDFYNPEGYFVEELTSPDDVLEIITEWGLGSSHDLLEYLSPTYPAEIGQRHRQLIVQELAKLKNRDGKFFSGLMNEMEFALRNIQRLSAKHLGGNLFVDRYTHLLIQRVADHSGIIMSKPFMNNLRREIEAASHSLR